MLLFFILQAKSEFHTNAANEVTTTDDRWERIMWSWYILLLDLQLTVSLLVSLDILSSPSPKP